MTKARKILVVLLSAILAFGLSMSVFAFTACGGGDPVELSSITLNTDDVQKVYVTGSKLNTTGLKVTATYSDGSSEELEASEYVIENADRTLTFTPKAPYESFQASETVKVSYTKGEVTKSRNFSVTVTNKITAATVNTSSTHQTEYFKGMSFNPNGLILDATLEDGSTIQVPVTTSNSKITPSGALSKGDTSVTVTIGGFDVVIPITLQNAIYVEAETGYRNGEPIEQTTGNEGNLRTDATTELSAGYATALYRAHLKAAFVESKLKAAPGWSDDWATTAATPDELYEALGGTQSVYQPGVMAGGEIISKLYTEIVKWLNDDANEEAILAYAGTTDDKGVTTGASEEFTNAVAAFEAGTNEDIAEWNYEDIAAQFVASGEGSGGDEYYLGQNGQGDTISFVFDSSKATTTGSIAFRLSSAYLYADSGWSPKIMGDIQFNKLCEISVNGVAQTVDDSKILKGGKTEDGSGCQGLWVYWDTVSFENVSFVEGRNVVELKIKEHGITAQESYNFAANVDTLIVGPGSDDSVELDTFTDEGAEVTATVTSATVAEEESEAVVTVGGSYTLKKDDADITGYVSDLVANELGVKVGTVNADVTLKAGNTFEAKATVTGLDPGEYPITLNDDNVTIDGFSGNNAVVGRATYTLKNADTAGNVVLDITSDYTVTLTSSEIETEQNTVDIAVVDGSKVILTVGGGTFDYTVTGYTITDDGQKGEVKAILETKLQEEYYLDFQIYDQGWGTPLGINFHTVTVDVDAKTFTISADVTDWSAGANPGMLHLKKKENGAKPSNVDFKPNIDAIDKSVVCNGKKYTLRYDSSKTGGNADECYGLANIKVVNATDPEATVTTTTVTESDGKVKLTLTGTCENITTENIKETISLYFDAVGEGQITDTEYTVPAARYDVSADNVTASVEGNTFTFTADITDLPEGAWWTHIVIGESDKDFEPTDVASATHDGKTYGFETHSVSWGGTRVFFMVKTAAA